MPVRTGVQQGGGVVAFGPEAGDREDLQTGGSPVAVRVRHGHADHQIRLVPPHHPLEPGSVPGPDGGAQLGGDPVLRVGERVGHRDEILVARDHDPGAEAVRDLRREPGERPLVGRQVEVGGDRGGPCPYVVHGGVLGAPEDGGPRVPVGERGRGHRADERAQDERHDEPCPQSPDEPSGTPFRGGRGRGGALGDGATRTPHSGPKR